MLLLFEQLINTVLLGFLGVVLDLSQSQVIDDHVVHGVGLKVDVEANYLEMIVLWEGHEIAAPLRLLGANESVTADATDAICIFRTDNRLMRVPQEIAALETFLVGAQGEVLDSLDILSHVIEIADVSGIELLS